MIHTRWRETRSQTFQNNCIMNCQQVRNCRHIAVLCHSWPFTAWLFRLASTDMIIKIPGTFSTEICSNIFTGTFSTGTFLQVLFNRYVSTGTFLQALFYGYFSTGIFLRYFFYSYFFYRTMFKHIYRYLLYRYFSTGTFQQVRFYRHFSAGTFPTGTFLQALFYGYFSTGIFLHVLFLQVLFLQNYVQTYLHRLYALTLTSIGLCVHGLV
jgi:hypothetical protein